MTTSASDYGDPGRFHRHGPDTERESAESVAHLTEARRQHVLRLLRAAPQGLTDDEGGALMGGDRLMFGRRRQELCMRGLVADSGWRRLTPARRKAVVWVLTDAPPEGAPMPHRQEIPDGWALVAFLPRTRYLVRPAANGWEVYGDGDPSFT